ncbi:MAG: hypothetical protein ACQEQU_01645 [Spirochaetota bacterium]
MKHERTITVLAILTAVAALVASITGFTSSTGGESFMHESVRGATVEIFGSGIYRHMSAEVAIQGIAQDYITAFLAVPLLLVTLLWNRRGSLRAQVVQTGVFAYFFVTYILYLAMATYNSLFLVYVVLLGLSFFGLYLSLQRLFSARLSSFFKPTVPNQFAGTFLIINAMLIALLWLSVILPPLLAGRLYPAELAHYTTMIVQGFDLGLFLPISFVVGSLMKKRTASGLIYGSVHLVFLSILMTALSAKIIAIGLAGGAIMPAVIVIPAVLVVSLYLAIKTLLALPSHQEVST